MALTRAQLLMGNSAQGAVLSGQVQGVRQGIGILINSNGTIDVNSQTIVGVVKMGQTPASAAAAYNSYDWPTGTGTAGQQLTISGVSGGVTALTWSDPDGIPWATKGQLVVGTGVNAQALLDVGANGSILIADSTTTTGLNYTSNFVATSGPAAAANLPAGPTTSRPSGAPNGALRYNSNTVALEFWNGAVWESLASSSINGFVEQTSSTGSAVMPVGTEAQRDGSPNSGYLRFNDDSNLFEFWNGTTWQSLASSSSGTFIDKTAPASGTPSAVIPVGTQAQRQGSPAAGYLRFNDDTDLLEVYTGAAWASVTSSTSGTFVAQTSPLTGSASAIIPTGTQAQRQTVPAPAAGYTRFNTTAALMEVYDGTDWVSVGAPPTAGLGISITGSIVKVAIPQLPSAPAAGTAAGQAVDGSLYWDYNLGAMFIRYNNGGSPTWVQIVPDAGGLDIAALPALP